MIRTVRRIHSRVAYRIPRVGPNMLGAISTRPTLTSWEKLATIQTDNFIIIRQFKAKVATLCIRDTCPADFVRCSVEPLVFVG